MTWTPQRHQAAKERCEKRAASKWDESLFNIHAYNDLRLALAEIERLQGVIEELNGRKSRQLCKTHPDVDYRHHWGCPECVRELRQRVEELNQLLGLVLTESERECCCAELPFGKDRPNDRCLRCQIELALRRQKEVAG